MTKSLIVTAVLALIAGATAPALLAEPGCTNADLVGVYGMLAPGNILVAPGFPPQLIGPFARVGQVVADGRGNISVTNTASYNGNIITESYNGTYTVSSDCSVDIKPIVGLPLGPGGSLVPVPFEFKGAIADNGASVAVVLCGLAAPCFAAPTGNVIRVLLTRNSFFQERCNDENLSGAFQLDMSGTVVSGPVPGPFAREGRLAFDGHGGFTGQTVADYSGFFIQPETISGTYSVDSLCNISLSYTAGTVHTWTGTLTELNNGADLIVSESGVVIYGTLKKQHPSLFPFFDR
jgi:hypothetical protein